MCSLQLLYKNQNKKYDKATLEQSESEKKRFKAICFILWVDNGRYKDLIDELRKGVYKGRDKYPSNVAAAWVITANFQAAWVQAKHEQVKFL